MDRPWARGDAGDLEVVMDEYLTCGRTRERVVIKGRRSLRVTPTGGFDRGKQQSLAGRAAVFQRRVGIVLACVLFALNARKATIATLAMKRDSSDGDFTEGSFEWELV